MISDYSSYLELLAAVYVSMLLDVDTLSKLWYPDSYYHKIESTLKEVFPDEEGEGRLNSKIVSASKNNAEIRNARMRCRALFMLAITAILLALLGYESSFDKSIISYEYWYNATLISYLLGVCLCFIGGRLFDGWNTTALGVIVVILCIVTLMFTRVSIPFYSSIAQYYPIIIILLVTLPVLYVIFSLWLFSSVYSGYLRNYVYKVKNEYDKAMFALQANDKKHIPRVYKKLIRDSIYTSNNNRTLSDICIQGYVDIRNNKLNEISRYPNGFVIFFSWLGFCFFRLERWIKKHFYHRNNDSPQLINMGHSNLRTKMNSQVVILNYQKEYDEFMIERAKKKGKLGVKEFCQIHGYDANAMVTWLKQRNK